MNTIFQVKIKSIKNIKPTPRFLFTTWSTSDSPRLFSQTTTFHKVQNHSPTCLSRGWIKSLLLLFRRRKAVLWLIPNIPSSIPGEQKSTFLWSRKKTDFQVKYQFVCSKNFWFRTNKLPVPQQKQSQKRGLWKVCHQSMVLSKHVASLWMWTQLEKMADEQEEGWRRWCSWEVLHDRSEAHAEGKSCVSIRMGITEPGSFTNLGRAAYGWEPWGCGLGQLGELKRHLKETRQRLEMQWMDEAATSIKLKTFYDSTNAILGQEKK